MPEMPEIDEKVAYVNHHFFTNIDGLQMIQIDEIVYNNPESQTRYHCHHCCKAWQAGWSGWSLCPHICMVESRKWTYKTCSTTP